MSKQEIDLQVEVIEDYPMDTVENKRKVPFVEKKNGDICLKDLQDYDRAIHHYNKALMSVQFLTQEESNSDEDLDYVKRIIEEVEIPGSMNLTLCYLKTNQFSLVIRYTSKVLDVEPENVKALYR